MEFRSVLFRFFSNENHTHITIPFISQRICILVFTNDVEPVLLVEWKGRLEGKNVKSRGRRNHKKKKKKKLQHFMSDKKTQSW